ncbi:hypothetical protein V1522DRAFT_414139 [Lipomyces starkeyi]
MAKYARSRDRIGSTYSRKRAVTACRVCRFRKTKCDNSRPVCGFCQKNGVICVFEELKSDYSTFDPASLAILDRLNDISSQIIQSQRLSTSEKSQESSAPDENDMIIMSTDSLNEQNILDWPIFGSSCRAVSAIDSSLSQADAECSGTDDGGDIPTNDLWNLIDHFLVNVHIKNPILDVQSLFVLARDVAKNGFRFDSSSCLLLHVCALGAVSTTYMYPQTNIGISSTETDCTKIQRSLLYFREASRRLSLVPKFSLLEMQCYALSGIYHMFTMRPLHAWKQFHTTSASCQIYLEQNNGRLTDTLSRSLEQRLFWTALKSECEIREYIPVPSFGIVNFKSPSMFPCPPCISSGSEQRMGLETIGGLASNIDATVERKSWYYYLTEILLRKIQNRVINTLYKHTNESWATMSFPTLVEIIREFETQLSDCHEQLADEIYFDLDTLHRHDEIIYHLQGRFWETYKYLYRPVLYCAIHTSAEATYPQYCAFVASALRKLFRYCSQGCHSIYYRHHGTWLVLRSMFTSSLILLAGLKSGRLVCKESAKECFIEVSRALRYWEDEVSGVRDTIKLLEGLCADVGMVFEADELLL